MADLELSRGLPQVLYSPRHSCEVLVPLLLVKEEIESAISNAKKSSELGSFFDSRSARPRTGLTSGWRARI